MIKNDYKILVVCQVYPIPENHGNPMRTMNFVRAFKEICGVQTKVDLIFKYGKQTDGKGSIFENEYEIEAVPLKKTIGNVASRIARGLPLQVSEFDSTAKVFFQDLASRRNYDFILFRYLTSTQLCSLLPPKMKSRTIVDYDDVASSSLFDRQGGPSVTVVKRTIAWVNRFFLKSYEKKYLDLGAALFCSTSDMETVCNQQYIQNTFVVPNIFEVEASEKHRPSNGYGNGNILLFLGTLNYPPNVEGLEWFVNSVFKEFTQVVTNAKLLVVGRKPVDSVKKLCEENPRIVLHADVPDVKPFYEICRTVVVPLLSGSGTRIKILEAAMMQRPVLSTPTGAAGLDFRDGHEIHLFNDTKEFKTKYLQLDSHEVYMQIVTKAKALVEKTYAKPNFNQSFEKALAYITGRSD